MDTLEKKAIENRTAKIHKETITRFANAQT